MKVFGTDRLMGMLSAPADNIIPDDFGQEVTNYDHSALGLLERSKLNLETAYGGNGGFSDIHVDQNTGYFYYCSGSVVGTDDPDGPEDLEVLYSGGCPQASESYPNFVSHRNAIYVLDCCRPGFATDRNWAIDGAVWRAMGPLEYTIPFTFISPQGTHTVEEVTSGNAITDVDFTTEAGKTIVTFTSAHGLSSGDRIYIDSSMAGAERLENRCYTVYYKDADEIYLRDADGNDIDGTSYTAWSSGGLVYKDGNGRVGGSYRYALTWRVTMPSGKVIESDLQYIYPDGSKNWLDYDFSLFVTTGPQEKVSLKIDKIPLTTVQDYIYTGGVSPPVLGTDVLVTARIWRTKADDDDFYLMTTEAHAFVVGNTGSFEVYDTFQDGDLGALYRYNLGDSQAAPAAEMGASMGARLYLVSKDNPNRLYISEAGRPEHFNLDNYIELDEEITALGVLGRSLIIFSPSRSWRYEHATGVGILTETDSREGCRYRRAVASTPHGLFFANERGAFLHDGAWASEVSGGIRDVFTDKSGGEWSMCYYDNEIYLAGRSGTNLCPVLSMRDENPRWRTHNFYTQHGVASPGLDFIAADYLNNRLVGGTSGGYVATLFTSGDDASATFVSKAYGDGTTRRAWRVEIDCEADSEEMDVYFKSNRSDYTQIATSQGTEGRQVVWVSTQDVVGEWFTVKIQNANKLYGVKVLVY